MKTVGPAMSFLTSCCRLPQNEQHTVVLPVGAFPLGTFPPGDESVALRWYVRLHVQQLVDAGAIEPRMLIASAISGLGRRRYLLRVDRRQTSVAGDRPDLH